MSTLTGDPLVAWSKPPTDQSDSQISAIQRFKQASRPRKLGGRSGGSSAEGSSFGRNEKMRCMERGSPPPGKEPPARG
jgi:hypothetical protein